ncbi:peroxiredoxin [Thiomicrospira sp. WB1]|uniref:peroxiredoxin n=1 Tax=Thiomicrospira sp. WB1 TaxID=1685380 RepID=UPI0007461FFB|nr:peroxiredoxin [Thiomicrospira sp. WB1]KUJ71809.1 alkyl hydroperoxide reductase [Thiomicrospira sp. WB1]
MIKSLHTQLARPVRRGLLLFFLLSSSVAVASQALSIGQTAPDFRLMDQHNQPHQLSDYQGKWLVLYFYPKNDTPGCTTEACSFRDNINRLIQQDAVVLGVSVDSQASHAAFAEKHDLPFSLLADTDADVAAQYGALLDLVVVKFAKRQTFIIAPDGTLAKIYRNVDPDTHVKQVLTDLKQLKTVATLEGD